MIGCTRGRDMQQITYPRADNIELCVAAHTPRWRQRLAHRIRPVPMTYPPPRHTAAQRPSWRQRRLRADRPHYSRTPTCRAGARHLTNVPISGIWQTPLTTTVEPSQSWSLGDGSCPVAVIASERKTRIGRRIFLNSYSPIFSKAKSSLPAASIGISSTEPGFRSG
jgi:hypothetical protein